ncbi:hypothetical protein SDC9_196342 [bioreactor metagenome]|uniref:Uncharacterized protein n=1 Tax=bioreactor metagenome TaxID=1076179 RepID=A0A645IC71_9ZZZZ
MVSSQACRTRLATRLRASHALTGLSPRVEPLSRKVAESTPLAAFNMTDLDILDTRSPALANPTMRSSCSNQGMRRLRSVSLISRSLPKIFAVSIGGSETTLSHVESRDSVASVRRIAPSFISASQCLAERGSGAETLGALASIKVSSSADNPSCQPLAKSMTFLRWMPIGSNEKS